jgi:predicted dinucleotide-binding enzyme
VAAGQIDGFWQYTDVRSGLAAGALLVSEAGGVVTDTRGRPWTLASEDFLACAPGVHREAVKLQAALPDTRVVKSLNTMLFTVMTNPRSLATPPTAFVSGNDADAKAQVSALLGELGWPPEWIMDLGGLESARATEALILMVPYVLRRHGFSPFALTVAR